MHDLVRAKYPYALLMEAVARTLNIKQMENENLIDYVKRFKQARDILTSHIGSKVLDQFIENTPEHRAAIDDMDLPRATELKANAFGRWMAFLLLKNSDQSKYGSLLNGLTSQYSMDNNQYPKTITAASDILAYHKHDAKPARQNRSGQAKKDDEGGTGHANNETSFAQSGKKKSCYWISGGEDQGVQEHTGITHQYRM